MNTIVKQRAARNRTITLSENETTCYASGLLRLMAPALVETLRDRIICQDISEVLPLLPQRFVDLVFVDPPYNMDKTYNGSRFVKTGTNEYATWVDGWLSGLVKVLKPTASVYICSDWRSSSSVHSVAARYFKIRNRITWEREKGRGALRNWKNCSEDIWFCTISDEYTFNLEDVKIRRRVIAPYTLPDGTPKDWKKTDNGDYRLTHPSNLWTDLTVPFWSMPENTDHPTQKPEKLLTKIILASSNPGDMIFDPFLGSGTAAVVAKKLGRHFVGVEREKAYCCLAAKRLELAEKDASIQGYNDGVFWERNTPQNHKHAETDKPDRRPFSDVQQTALF